MGNSYHDYCDHDWHSDWYLRVCLKCGQLRTFPGREVEEEPKVLWPRRGAKVDPQELFSKQQKSAIAHLAKEMGISKLAKVSGIPVTLLRAWVVLWGREKTAVIGR